MPELLVQAALVALAYYLLFFVVAQVIRNNSIVDMGWGAGFILVALATMFLGGAYGERNLLMVLLVTIWGGRLTYHIVRRNWGREEDFRYAKWRKEWGRWLVPRAFFQVFILQGLLMLVIVYPVILVHAHPRSGLVWSDYLGLLVWLVGFYFESVGDRQLAVFLKDPANRGRVIRSGLWRYTRHPNYFGEATMWWGIFILASSSPLGWTALVSPVTITTLLLFISGVPLLEKEMMKNPQFQAYARVTSKFVPWFPGKEENNERGSA